jgi:hypothetical protein
MRYIAYTLALCYLLASSIACPVWAAGPAGVDEPGATVIQIDDPICPLLGEPDNPIPLGVPYLSLNARGRLEIQVLKANFNAYSDLLGPMYSRFAYPPAKGNKFVMVRIRVTNRGEWEQKAWIWKGDFGATNATGDPIKPSGTYVHDRLFSDLKGGDIVEGEIVFEVPLSEDNLLLFYAPDYLGLERTYFAIK